MQLVRDPIGEDRLDTRVGEDQLVEPLGGRIAVERGLDVLGDAVRDLGQPLEQLRDDLARVTARRRLSLGVTGFALVAVIRKMLVILNARMRDELNGVPA